MQGIRRFTGFLAPALLLASTAGAEPLDLLGSWEGTIDYFIIGAPLAIDGPDTDTTQVDTLDQPAFVDVTATDVPAAAGVVEVYLFWGGTIPDQDDCATAPSEIDDEVGFTVPGATAPVSVVADECFCEIGATSYDIQSCRANVSTIVTSSGMHGSFGVEGFDALIRNGSTDNASFALVIVYDEPDLLDPRRVALYDGLEELYLSSRSMTLAGLDVDTPARGDLAWYVLDGDVGGTGTEHVEVSGIPGGASTRPWDSVNPVDNPMNRTINTVTPPATGVIGVDVDMLDIAAGLTPGDTSALMTYATGEDKYWVVLNMIGINVYKAHIATRSSRKSWDLLVDADSSSTPTPGDTIRFTIHLENVGTAPGYADLTDEIPPEFSSWSMVSTGGGTDESSGTTLHVVDIFLAVGGTADVLFDAVIGTVADGTSITNLVDFDAGPEGNSGTLVAPPVVIGGEVPDETPEPVDEVVEVVDTVEPVDATDADTDLDATPDTAPDVPGDEGDTSRGCGCSVPGG